ncbi:MAG: peptide deformylase, partial [Pseudomonadota bacterium]
RAKCKSANANWRGVRGLAVLPLRFAGDPVLGQIAAPVLQFDTGLGQCADDMLATMYDAKGRGLAGPQVGITKRIFVIDTDWKDARPDPKVCVNPVITARSAEMAAGTEACLSIPGKTYAVARPAWIDAIWQDATGAGRAARLHGVKAICFCHELVHLNGVLISDHGVLQ